MARFKFVTAHPYPLSATQIKLALEALYIHADCSYSMEEGELLLELYAITEKAPLIVAIVFSMYPIIFMQYSE